MINLATFLVIIVVFCGVFNFRKLRKSIQRRYDREYLENVRKEVSFFDEYKKEEKKHTPEKIKQLKKMKGKYND